MKGVRSWSARAQREVAKGPPDGTPKHRSKKDTKRWCKGIEGREHKWEFGESKYSRFHHGRGGGGAPVTALICAGCRREQRIVRHFFSDKLGPGF